MKTFQCREVSILGERLGKTNACSLNHAVKDFRLYKWKEFYTSIPFSLSLARTAMASFRFISRSIFARCPTVHSGCLLVTLSNTAFKGLLMSFMEQVQVIQLKGKEQWEARCLVFFTAQFSGSNKITRSSRTSRLSSTVCKGADRMAGPTKEKMHYFVCLISLICSKASHMCQLQSELSITIFCNYCTGHQPVIGCVKNIT